MTAREIILGIVAFLFTNPINFIIFVFIMLLLAWLIMKQTLKLDDIVWGFFTDIILAIVIFGLMVYVSSSDILSHIPI